VELYQKLHHSESVPKLLVYFLFVKTLKTPKNTQLVAYLCIGYVDGDKFQTFILFISPINVIYLFVFKELVLIKYKPAILQSINFNIK